MNLYEHICTLINYHHHLWDYIYHLLYHRLRIELNCVGCEATLTHPHSLIHYSVLYIYIYIYIYIIIYENLLFTVMTVAYILSRFLMHRWCILCIRRFTNYYMTEKKIVKSINEILDISLHLKGEGSNLFQNIYYTLAVCETKSTQNFNRCCVNTTISVYCHRAGSPFFLIKPVSSSSSWISAHNEQSIITLCWKQQDIRFVTDRFSINH